MIPFYVSLKPFLDFRTCAHPVPWQDIFANTRPLEVEIGFGNGEYLARLAQSRKDVNFIGFEEYCQRIHRTLRKLSRGPVDHVRVFRMDVRPAFEYLFAPRSISYVHCLYPPPWPKKSDAKHRLFTADFLKLTNNRLVEGGTLKIVTDHYPYVAWIKEQLPGTGFQLQENHIKASYGTKFEKKWVGQGKEEFYELLLTKKEAMDVPQKKEALLKQYTFDHFDPQGFTVPPYSQEGIAVVFKDLLFDPKRKTAMVHLLVNDEHLSQNIRIVIIQTDRGWIMNLAEGTMMMPTAGVAKALDLVYQAACAGVSPAK